MKKTFTYLCIAFIANVALAAQYNVTISGFTYSPATVNAVVGDTISIAASTVHPLVQVDQSNWNSNTPTPMSGGWGTKTTTYTFVITSATNIYYGCANHMASMGMKGVINVTSTGIKSNISVNNNVSLYPNPAINGEFAVKSTNASNGRLFIYDVTGKQLESYTLNSGETNFKSALPIGEYIYVITYDQKEVYRNKFIITK